MNVFDEKVYLDPKVNKEIIRSFDDNHSEYTSSVMETEKKYSESISEYDRYITLIAYLIKVLSIPNNSISASIILKILTDNGLFSDDGVFKCNTTNNSDLAGHLGMGVINGNGCCRHISKFQHDVLSKMNLMSDQFYCYLWHDNDSNDKSNEEANHAINLIEYNCALYGYDALNGLLFKFISDRELITLFSNSDIHLYYKPYVDMLVDGMKAENANYLFSLFDTLKDRKLISLEEYRFIYMHAIRTIGESAGLIKEFRNVSKSRIKRITDGLCK